MSKDLQDRMHIVPDLKVLPYILTTLNMDFLNLLSISDSSSDLNGSKRSKGSEVLGLVFRSSGRISPITETLRSPMVASSDPGILASHRNLGREGTYTYTDENNVGMDIEEPLRLYTTQGSAYCSPSILTD